MCLACECSSIHTIGLWGPTQWFWIPVARGLHHGWPVLAVRHAHRWSHLQSGVRPSSAVHRRHLSPGARSCDSWTQVTDIYTHRVVLEMLFLRLSPICPTNWAWTSVQTVPWVTAESALPALACVESTMTRGDFGEAVGERASVYLRPHSTVCLNAVKHK